MFHIIPFPAELRHLEVGFISEKEEALAVDWFTSGSAGFLGAQNASFDSSAISRIAERLRGAAESDLIKCNLT